VNSLPSELIAEGYSGTEVRRKKKTFHQQWGKKNVAKHMQLSRNFPSYAKTFNVFLHPIPSKNLILGETLFHKQPTTKPAGLKNVLVVCIGHLSPS
jgi:hypothetical protein